MFCIASFIVLGIMALFSATYRPLAAKAWHCVWRRVTLRPCDISFGEELKGRIIGSFIVRAPRVARFLHRWIDWISFTFVGLSLWSLLYVGVAGLNLWVYDTCNPQAAESCSLSGEACGVDQYALSLSEAWSRNELGTWAIAPFVRFAETVSRIPDRLKTWEPSAYLAPTATYAHPPSAERPDALEVIDPGCRFCRKLTTGLLEAGADRAYDMSYLLYPIPTASGATKFRNSRLMASYIEAAKSVDLPGRGTDDLPGDWQLLEALFGENEAGALQDTFNLILTPEQAETQLRSLLTEIGYTPADVERIATLAGSPEVAGRLAEQKRIVEEEIRTIKIPTLIVNGRRYDRVIDPATLIPAP